ASSVPGDYLLPALLAAFGPKHPHVRVRAVVSDSAGVIAQLDRGEVSVGLVGQKPDVPYLDARHLADDRMVLIAPPGHALARRKSVPLTRLTAHPLILREAGSGS